jgi:vacuolar-type H+-ATPase subunit E/Vma4
LPRQEARSNSMALKADKKAIDYVINVIDSYIEKKYGKLDKMPKDRLYRLRMKYFKRLLKEYRVHKLPKSGLFVLEVIK